MIQFSHGVHAAEVVDRLEAIVNKKAIYLSDEKKFKTLIGLRSKVDPLFNTNPISKKSSPSNEEIIQFLIDEEIIGQKFPVTDSELESEISSIQSNLKINREGLKTAIQSEGYKFEDYYKMMRLSLSKRQLLDREIRNRAAVSDDDVKNEYQKSQFGSKSFQGSFHLFIIKINKKTFKTAALAKDSIQSAYKSIEAGATFEDTAKSISEDPSASDGGDLGFVSFLDLSAFLQSSVRKLAVGTTSEVLEDPNHFYILKVTEIKSSLDEGFEKEKDRLRAKLMESEFQNQIKLWLERQRSINFVKRTAKV